MAEPNPKPEQWGERYETQRPLYVDFTKSVEQLLHRLLSEAGIPYVQIEARTKAIPNFVAKLRRKDSKYQDPLQEVTDLAGIRIVLYYLDDIERVGELIEEQFAVDGENSVDKSAALDPDRFGYLSVHHIVRMSSARAELPEWKRYQGLCAEVQVRTVLQHAWAAISRKLAYASVKEAPRDLQRNLNRLSALLELADSEFLDIRASREAIEEQYDLEVERGNLDLALDESSLEVYLRESGVPLRLGGLAQAEGSPTEASKAAALGYEEGEAVATVRDVLAALHEVGYERISDLDDFLEGAWERIPPFMREINEGFRDSDDRPISDDPLNWLVLVVLALAEAPSKTFEKLNYVDELIELITSTYDH